MNYATYADEMRACELELACADVGLMEGWSLGYLELARRISESNTLKKKVRQKMARLRAQYRRRQDARRSSCEAASEVRPSMPCVIGWLVKPSRTACSPMRKRRRGCARHVRLCMFS